MTPRSVGETYSNTKHTTGGKGALRPQLPAACRAAVTLPAQAERTRVVNKSGLITSREPAARLLLWPGDLIDFILVGHRATP